MPGGGVSPQGAKFQAFNEKLNLDIVRRFEARGIQLSLPFRHSFWKHDAEQGPIDVNPTGGGTARENG